MKTATLTDANAAAVCRLFIARARPFFSLAADCLVEPAATPPPMALRHN
jgi:hypothetical protein